MIDTNTLSNISNLLSQAGYTIKATPIPEAYTGAGTAIIAVATAVLAAVAAIGRALQAWKTDGSVLRGLFLGTNTPKALVDQVKTNTDNIQTDVAQPPVTTGVAVTAKTLQQNKP